MKLFICAFIYMKELLFGVLNSKKKYLFVFSKFRLLLWSLFNLQCTVHTNVKIKPLPHIFLSGTCSGVQEYRDMYMY